MATTAQLPASLCTWLSGISSFAGYSFCVEFPASSLQTPLCDPVIVIGIDNVKVLDNTTDDTGNIVTGTRLCEDTYKLGIHVPRTSGGNTCYEIMDSILEQLLFNTNLCISGVKGSPIEYIRNTDSLFLGVTFTVAAKREAAPSYSTAAFSG